MTVSTFSLLSYRGYACFVCKTHLYSTLETVANEVMKQQLTRKEGLHQPQSSNDSFILYNGTNADDTLDPTRLGLIAASNFSVHSPLDQITKDEVRQAAKYLGLPNWNAAASPCLRSRLAMCIRASKDHLQAVEDELNQRPRKILNYKSPSDIETINILQTEIDIIHLYQILTDKLFFHGKTDITST